MRRRIILYTVLLEALNFANMLTYLNEGRTTSALIWSGSLGLAILAVAVWQFGETFTEQAPPVASAPLPSWASLSGAVILLGAALAQATAFTGGDFRFKTCVSFGITLIMAGYCALSYWRIRTLGERQPTPRPTHSGSCDVDRQLRLRHGTSYHGARSPLAPFFGSWATVCVPVKGRQLPRRTLGAE